MIPEEEIELAAEEHAFDVLGQEQFDENKSAVESISGDFKEGVKWAMDKLKENPIDHIEWATLNVLINEKHGHLLIPEKKWKAINGALHEAVGDDGWNDDWDY